MYRLIVAAALVTGCTVNVTNTNPKIGIGEKATVKTDVKAGVTTEAKPDAEPQALTEAAPSAVPSVPVTPDPNAPLTPEQADAQIPKGPCYVYPYRPEFKEMCEKYGHDKYGMVNPHETPSPEPSSSSTVCDEPGPGCEKLKYTVNP